MQNSNTGNKPIILVLLLLLAGATSACGDDTTSSRIDGIYKVLSQTENSDGCSDEGESTLTDEDPLYFKIQIKKFMGEMFSSYMECDSPAECNDDDDFNLGDWFFTGKEGHAWVGQPWSMAVTMGGNSDSSAECSLSFARVRATRNGANIRMEQRHYSGNITVESDEECKTELVDDNLDIMTCKKYVVRTGTTDF